MKIVITARNFNVEGCRAKEMLIEKGYDVVDLSEEVFDNEADYLNAVKDADAVINAVEPMGEETLKGCESLKLISVRGIGYDHVDAAACKKYGIDITRTVGAVEAAVAEQVMAYVMYFARRIDLQNNKMQQGRWERIMMGGARHMTLGIIGFGGIGRELAKRAEAFDMNVIYYCRTPKTDTNAQFVPLDELAKRSDYIALCLPLTEETRGFCGEELISKMKNGAVLINVARGAVADNNAIKAAVEEGRLAGAAIDVFEYEPCTDSVLKGVENVVLTPHTSPYTQDNFITMNELTAQNVIDYFDGCIKSASIV